MNDLIKDILVFLLGGGTFSVLLIWALNNPAKIEQWQALFFRSFNWVSKKLEYGTVATGIQSKVNSYGEKMSQEVKDVLPQAMKIEWKRSSESVEASLRNGEVVVTLDYSKNLDRNLVVSTLAYLGKGLLPLARPYIDPILARATDFTVAKDIFVSSGQDSATGYFFENFLKPEMDRNAQLGKDCQKLDLLAGKGYFTRIYLRQLKLLGDKMYPSTPDNLTATESRNFADFLERIASKGKGIDVPGGLTFSGSKIRVSVLLVARAETLEMYGLQRHRRRIELCRNRGIDYVYVCGIGRQNILLAEHLAKEQESTGSLVILDSQRFRTTVGDRELYTVCVLCKILHVKQGMPYSEIDMVITVLEEYISEIAENKVEVLFITRNPGIKSKVVVHALQDDVDAVGICSDPVKLTAMQFALGGENLEFIKWSDEPESLILSSLGLKPEQVVELTVDANKKDVIILVKDNRAKSSAVGYENLNLKMAMDLTGFNIVIEVAQQVKGPKNDS